MELNGEWEEAWLQHSLHYSIAGGSEQGQNDAKCVLELSRETEPVGYAYMCMGYILKRDRLYRKYVCYNIYNLCIV